MNHPKGTRLKGQNSGELAEETLRESEEKFRACFAHAPESNVGLPALAELLDTSSIQRLMDDFYAFSHVPMAILDAKGRVLVGVGWQEICTQFHRVNPETCRHCLESDLHLSAGLGQGESRLYKCKNHMWDMATPIFVAGQHVGNVFTGQFFFEDETVDRNLFSAQARRYGFNEAKYLSALERAPRLSRETVQRGMNFLVNLADTISHLGYSNVQLARLLAERKEAEDALRLSEEKFSVAFEENPAAITMTRLEDGLFYEVNDTWLKLNGYGREEVIGQLARQVSIWPSAEAANRFLAELKASGSVRGWEQECTSLDCFHLGIPLDTARKLSHRGALASISCNRGPRVRWA